MLIPAYYDAPDHPEGSVPMRGDDPRHEAMFSYVTPEARVRPDHPLRPIRRMTDAALERLSSRFDRLYSTTGRPSIPPEKLLRALLLQMLYSIRSERLLMEELDYSVLYRWFVGPEPRRSRSGTPPRSRRIATGCSRATSPTRSLRKCWPRSSRTACSPTSTSRSTARLLEAWASHKSFKPKGARRADRPTTRRIRP